jgi:site-specific DNA-methyltransferase (adenine-specific)
LPVLVLDVDEKEASLLLATLDPLAAMAGTDAEKLDVLLKDLTVNSDAVAAMLEGLANEHPLPGGREPVSEDEVPDLLPEAVSRAGDLWTLGDHLVLCGDCTLAGDVDKVMGGEGASLVLTDPPYGIDYVGKTDQAMKIANDDLAGLGTLLHGAFAQCLRVTKPGAVWYVAAPAGPQFLFFAEELAALKVWRQTLVWAKDSMVLGHSHYHYRHENIMYGWTPGGCQRTPPDRTKTSVLEYPRPKASREHPTAKPVSLWAELLGNSSEVGDIVFEPFSGSGTSIVACERLQRRCRAVEVIPQFVDCAVARWERLTGREAVLHGTSESWRAIAKARGVKIKPSGRSR